MTASSPRLLNLGHVKGPLVIFGGPYSNLHATAALEQELTARGYAPSQIICTGDLVAYCADPAQTVELIERWGIHCIQGNIEVQVSADSDDCGCNFAEGSACDILSGSWFAYARSQLKPKHAAWMGALPGQLTFTIGGLRARVVHGGVSEISQFIFRSTPHAVKAAEMAKVDADVILSGHAGIPFIDQLGPRSAWINAGVIGMPANDGQPRVWYLEVTEQSGGVRFAHRSIGYDHEAASRAMVERRLPMGYARALVSGLWPSLDVLPGVEKEQQGQPLDLAPLLLHV